MKLKSKLLFLLTSASLVNCGQVQQSEQASELDAVYHDLDKKKPREGQDVEDDQYQTKYHEDKNYFATVTDMRMTQLDRYYHCLLQPYMQPGSTKTGVCQEGFDYQTALQEARQKGKVLNKEAAQIEFERELKNQGFTLEEVEQQDLTGYSIVIDKLSFTEEHTSLFDSWFGHEKDLVDFWDDNLEALKKQGEYAAQWLAKYHGAIGGGLVWKEFGVKSIVIRTIGNNSGVKAYFDYNSHTLYVGVGTSYFGYEVVTDSEINEIWESGSAFAAGKKIQRESAEDNTEEIDKFELSVIKAISERIGDKKADKLFSILWRVLLDPKGIFRRSVRDQIKDSRENFHSVLSESEQTVNQVLLSEAGEDEKTRILRTALILTVPDSESFLTNVGSEVKREDVVAWLKKADFSQLENFYSQWRAKRADISEVVANFGNIFSLVQNEVCDDYGADVTIMRNFPTNRAVVTNAHIITICTGIGSDDSSDGDRREISITNNYLPTEEDGLEISVAPVVDTIDIVEVQTEVMALIANLPDAFRSAMESSKISDAVTYMQIERIKSGDLDLR